MLEEWAREWARRWEALRAEASADSPEGASKLLL